MTITLSDAALGLAETTCGILLVGCVILLLAWVVLDVINDSRIAEQDRGRRSLIEERDRLMADVNVAEVEAAKYKRDVAEYRDRIEYAIAVLKGEDEEEGKEETS